MTRSAPLVVALVAAFAVPAAAAEPVTAPTTRPKGASGTAIVPDRFLRRWDPVTVFFARDVGPPKGGPEDHSERVVTVTPSHPGAFTWLDARTLQFRPAEPWPPLARFTWSTRDVTVRLTTLMAAPKTTLPANDAVGLERVETITVTFAEPIDPADDAKTDVISMDILDFPIQVFLEESH